MIHRLSVILKKCKYNPKFKRGFIKYLSSLDFEEYYDLYNHYMSIIIRIYIPTEKSKFLSKQWFKNRFLKRKYNFLYNMFISANESFIWKIHEITEYKNKIGNKIEEASNLLSNITNNAFICKLPPSSYDLIKFSIFLSDTIFMTQELEILLEEYKKIK